MFQFSVSEGTDGILWDDVNEKIVTVELNVVWHSFILSALAICVRNYSTTVQMGPTALMPPYARRPRAPAYVGRRYPTGLLWRAN